MVFVEVFQEIVPDNLSGRPLAAKGVSDELKVLLQRFRTIDNTDEVNEPPHDIVVEILVVANGEDIVPIGDKRLVFARIPVAASVGESFNVKGVPPEHASHGIANQTANLAPQISAMHGDVLFFYLWR